MGTIPSLSEWNLFHDLRLHRYHAEGHIGRRADAPVTRNGVVGRLHVMGVPTRRGIMTSHLEPPCRSMGVALPNNASGTRPCAAGSVLAALDAAIQGD
jgi:hypothetical protein